MTKRNLKAKLIIELEKAPIVQIACTRSGVARSTYYRWRKEDLEFRERVETAMRQGRARVSDMAESVLIKLIKEGNLTAVIFWLKSNFASQYAPKTMPLNSISEEEEAELEAETERLRKMIDELKKNIDRKQPEKSQATLKKKVAGKRPERQPSRQHGTKLPSKGTTTLPRTSLPKLSQCSGSQQFPGA